MGTRILKVKPHVEVKCLKSIISCPFLNYWKYFKESLAHRWSPLSHDVQTRSLPPRSRSDLEVKCLISSCLKLLKSWEFLNSLTQIIIFSEIVPSNIFIHSFIRSFVRSFVRSFIHSFIQLPYALARDIGLLYTALIFLILILLELKMISHPYRARPSCTSMLSGTILLTDHLQFLILISLKMTMTVPKVEGGLCHLRN